MIEFWELFKESFHTLLLNKMRTTLDLPENLIAEAMALTHIQTKTDLIKIAIQNLIQKEKIKDLKKFYGKVDLGIDLKILRNR